MHVFHILKRFGWFEHLAPTKSLLCASIVQYCFSNRAQWNRYGFLFSVCFSLCVMMCPFSFCLRSNELFIRVFFFGLELYESVTLAHRTYHCMKYWYLSHLLLVRFCFVFVLLLSRSKKKNRHSIIIIIKENKTPTVNG